jgi:hypothetical protein
MGVVQKNQHLIRWFLWGEHIQQPYINRRREKRDMDIYKREVRNIWSAPKDEI